ncbi:MAG: ArsA-related P-loop ATPase [Pseudomonadota bacterium]
MTTPSLRDVIEKASLVVCVGPGGVGKTTISAVLALHAAATRRRALVLTIDPARRLADALSLPGLTNDPVAITGFAKMHPGGSLHALMLDPTATFDHMIAMLVPDEARRQALLANRFYQHMSRSLAGTLEYMAVERLHTLTRSGDYNAVVLDTPPTTNALDFLDAPDRLAVFFNEKIMRWFVPGERASSWTARLVDRAGATAMGLLSKVAGEEFVDETRGFFSAFSDLLGDFRSRGERVGRLLRDPSTTFIVVTSADAQRLDEAREIDRRLGQSGCHAGAFVVNRVDSPFLPPDVDVERALSQATTLLGGSNERERVHDFIERLEVLRHSRDVSASRHAEAVDLLRAQAGGRPVFTAPRVPAGQSPRASLLAIYLGLFADAASE